MRKFKDQLFNILFCLSTLITVMTLVIIIGYILKKGFRLVSWDFIFGKYPLGEHSGIYPMIITTFYTVALTLLIATPIGILAAVYLQEYAKQGALVKAIRFAIESLAGIPSIIYGLFGALFFVTYLKFNYSILACSLTLSIMILPFIIRTTEEAILAVPPSYKEASLALGSTHFQTLYKIIVPSAVPGVIAGVILAIGRIIGESAAVYLTAGTVAAMPKNIMSSARTLTVHAYLVTNEFGDIELASAIGVVLIVIVLFLNFLARSISRYFSKADY
ncbi:MAG: phosphate ABC transporter permease PstA [Clostridiales bacterium]|uniref:phosphate ABC transporter permease PstA n=1 Tax=Clostridium sp. N3C TaxID=1776758 RepID=UPI00092E03EA|nr:phosphate ABC transporter permease PstA [Clostridium sp. N3C]NLZ49121.1 phosphate ABC transporter permease PstA [Clostridiales bacterium]SCN22092.1 Phosphate transport system permease protein PstA [Clostridium sp. N3C]